MLVGVLAFGPLLTVACGVVQLGQDWRNADRSSFGIAPAPQAHREAVVQVYAARAFDWRGVFAVHTWIATKARDTDAYTVHEVLGWYARRGGRVVVSRPGVPDRAWYGNPPELVTDVRGETAEALIPQVERAVAEYPYPDEYTLWPGPNSNTFVAWVGRRVPGLQMNLPSIAIGKDYVPDGVLASAPSGGGLQVSLFGLLGVLVAPIEGLEVNLLGLSFGIDPLMPALKLPAFGRLGLARNPATGSI